MKSGSVSCAYQWLAFTRKFGDGCEKSTPSVGSMSLIMLVTMNSEKTTMKNQSNGCARSGRFR